MENFKGLVSELEEIVDILEDMEGQAIEATDKLDRLAEQYNYKDLDESQKQIVDDLFDGKIQPLINKITKMLN